MWFDEHASDWTVFLGAFVTAASVWIAVDPEGPERVIYKLRLWMAHRKTNVNQGRLDAMRKRAQLGLYADDMQPAEAEG